MWQTKGHYGQYGRQTIMTGLNQNKPDTLFEHAGE